MSLSVSNSDTEKGRANDMSTLGSINNYGTVGERVTTDPVGPPKAGPVGSLSIMQENMFLILITLTQLVQMIPLGAAINSGVAIGESLGATHIQSVLIVASYPLSQAPLFSFGGRLGAVWGHKYTRTLGYIIWTCWAICGGYSPNLVAMCLMRAFNIDLIVTSAKIITKISVPIRYQGVAGSLVGTLLSYGMSTVLRFAGTVEANTPGTG
ncbi:hypothetical protein NM208_g169 [Fusarium decemcellulare]|uniref:Uncharacterized protein n=1 Tax=Fusarium decemcellulare TaxID=57161 RepID=A0ACC1T0M9_9HYPO|nr:hypothetical protein NM208_g169 [Fusarium decemcellulare]